MKIGVFDSGMGGLSVANAIKAELPENEILFVNDAHNLPYGSKTPEQLFELVVPILQDMVERGCAVIVIACNTVTTTLIAKLREVIPVPLVGMEPMVKPAAEQTKTGVIAVCATPTTLASARYRRLKRQYAQGVTVLEPDCSNWAFMIESKTVDQEAVKRIIDDVCARQADVIVLGCTHYHWIEELIKTIAASRAVVLQPEQPVISQLKKVLALLR